MLVIASASDIAENLVGKGENAYNQHFILFPRCFQRPYLSMLLAKKWVIFKLD